MRLFSCARTSACARRLQKWTKSDWTKRSPCTRSCWAERRRRKQYVAACCAHVLSEANLCAGQADWSRGAAKTGQWSNKRGRDEHRSEGWGKSWEANKKEKWGPKCFECQERGHMAKDCPNKKAKK